jgi:dihydroorotase
MPTPGTTTERKPLRCGQQGLHGIAQGIIDVLNSDHAPHTLEEEAKTYPASPSGTTGVQTLVPVMLDHVSAGKLSLAQFVDLISA